MAKLWELLFPPPVRARHIKRTLLFSPDDQAGQPTRELIELSLTAARAALDIDLGSVSRRMPSSPRWPDLWPGEHYRLLAALVRELRPATVIEVGTWTGTSALSMMEYLPEDGRLFTFDLLDWRDVPETCLREADFDDGRLTQVLADLSDPAVFAQHREKLEAAELLFIDGPKDGKFEPALLSDLRDLSFARPPILVFDDIKDWNMLKTWRELDAPKLDFTSLGHWTGTGVVQWSLP